MRYGLRKMFLMAVTAAVATIAAFAVSPAGAATITVGKSGATFTNVQSAVNAAKAGDVIEIVDEGVYNEQITIDSTKSGITLRSKNPTSLSKPIIRWRDTKNTSPINSTEAKDPVLSANFETCAAVRVIRAKGVTIEGIAIDGGGPFAFGYKNVWCDDRYCENPNNHGNAAITLIVSGGAIIRDCDVKNAFFGIFVKDRNTGGAFANPNASDNDVTIPVSAFGKAGGHVFEYNRVNNNVVGFFFESAWDLGSTVRYNLIYLNKKANLSATAWNWVGDAENQKNAGAFMFKDNYLSPVAIYNNTLFDNTGNFLGHWQSGGQHLIFNNIFSKSTLNAMSTGTDRNANHMSLDGAFPFRMNNNVFSVDPAALQVQCRTELNCAENSEVAPGGCFVQAIQSAGQGFGSINGPTYNFVYCTNPSITQSTYLVRPGTLFQSVYGSSTITIPAANENRWLQTEGGQAGSGGVNYSTQLPKLFQSLVATDPNFLVPDWNNTYVQQFIKNKGWPTAGIRNNDGNIADLGAISSTGIRPPTSARIVPNGIVIITGTDAVANFALKVENGTMTNAKIKMLRWIAPIPENNTSTTNWPSGLTTVPQSAIKTIPNTSTIRTGNNLFSFSPGAVPAATKYGFFEVIAEGTDANGNAVTSDVGFLPYRALPAEVMLRYTAGVGGKITGTLTQNVKSGASGTAVTAVADAGYLFSGWSDGIATAQRRDIEVIFGVDAVAIFVVEDPVTLTYNAGLGGVVSGAAVQVIPRGGNGSAVTAAGSAARFTFESWSDGVTTATRTDRAVAADKTVTANFTASSYILTYSAGAGGRILGTASQTVLPGANGDVVAAVANEGYAFAAWSDGVKTSERTDKSVRADIAVTALFEQTTFKLTYTAATGGSILGAASQTVERGASGDVVAAIANEGYRFVAWSDGVKTAERTDKNVTANVTFTANFERTTFNLKYSAGANGVISGEASQTVARDADGSPVAAVANEGYVFASWSDGVTTAERTDKNVSADVTVTATFRLDKYTLSYRLGVGGKSFIGDTSQIVTNGGNGTEVYATSETGYTFAYWSDGSTDNPRTDKNVTGDIAVTAYFADPDGYVSVKSGGRVVPPVKPGDVAAVAPINMLTAEFAAGPNPAGKSSGGAVKFFRQGKRLADGALTVYDVSGNAVSKVIISDVSDGKSAVNQSKRVVGTWDLTDRRGRPAAAGAYLVKGAVKAKDGKPERVSLVVVVR